MKPMKKIRFYFVDIAVAYDRLRAMQGQCDINVKKTIEDGFIDMWTYNQEETAKKYGARIGEVLAIM